MANSSNIDRFKLFEERKHCFGKEVLVLQNKYNLVSTFRILFFILGIILLVYFSNERDFNPVLVLIFLLPILFGFFINYHNRIKYKLHQFKFLSKINEEEISRKKLELSAFDKGAEFVEPTHPYTSDLNIFGKHSLFQLINRTATNPGKVLLSEILKTPLKSKNTIEERQSAVKELSEKLDWRQQFEAHGRHEVHLLSSYEFLINWIKNSKELTSKTLLRIFSIVLPIGLIGSLIGYFNFELPGYLTFIFLLGNILTLFQISKIITPAIEKTAKSASLLKTYSALLNSIEEENFSSPLLINLKEKVTKGSGRASSKIKKLSTIVGNLEMRNNPYFAATINVLVLWDLQWLLALENWKKEVKEQIEQWLDAVQEFDAYNSLAGFFYNNEELIFPEIQEDKFIVEGKNINHPLIRATKRVSNVMYLQGLGKTSVITGSNMSGKSTYMRTVGINSVLGLIGAPVFATEYKLSPMFVFTCMHIHDSLEEETSSFYAELKRIKQLLTLLNQPFPVFYLLDELLKGTNSVDRNLGAKALIRQLHTKNASGLISTHDLELGDMEKELEGFVKNYSFNSSIIDNEIVFDYKLKDGICHSFNASKLMEKMGIELGLL